ncbi:MAG: hypothetical protein QHH27_04875 [Clostridia bacterium]|jgi:hypothetical protein|nr:hypothetical protein [Clostridia bacterium]MDH7572869.1 hypothetical protein [Clostridia bacterium]
MPISILLDGREAAVAETGAEAVELVRKLEAEQNRVDRVLVSVRVDGEESLDWEEKLSQSLPQRVELATAPLRVALAAAVDATLAELPRMGEGFCVAARLLREGDVAEAGRILLPLLGGLESYLALLQYLGRLDARCSSGAARTVASLDEGLEAVLSAWGMGDFQRVSIVLEEVLASEVEAGRGWLAEIRPLLQQEE